MLAPEVGRFESRELTTDCFSARAGLVVFDVALNGQGSASLALAIPSSPELIGAYLAGQAFAFDGDLRPSNCASFLVATRAVVPDILETFDTAAQHERSISGADWANRVAGALLPAPVGGSGELGVFDHRLGTLLGSEPTGPWVFDTDGHVFPGSATLSGQPVRVTDGRFEFLELTIPAGVTVRFVGSKPARVLVTGNVRIDGTLDARGAAVERADDNPADGAGQAGGAGGPGAGAGGAGGDLPGVVGGNPDGRAGEDLRVPPGSPLHGRTTDTGGRGSVAVPTGALASAVTYRFFGFFSNQIAAGGGGGGLSAAGLPGSVVRERAPGGEAGAAGRGGLGVLVPPTSARSRDALSIGGSGGGGGGVHPYDSVLGRPLRWARGAAGAGGGGAVLIAAGGDLTIARGGALLADGGAASRRDHTDGLLLAPGGGGSGGSVLLQCGGRLRNEGLVSAAGGRGGASIDARATPGAEVRGGDGAPGVIRVESPQPASRAELGVMDPPPGPDTAATLLERDVVTLAASRWYRVPPGGDPALLAYELYAVIDAFALLYSDVPGVGVGPARRGATPVAIATRSGELDAQGQLVPGTAGPWTEGSAAPGPSANAVQVLLFFDRAAAADVRVEALRLRF